MPAVNAVGFELYGIELRAHPKQTLLRVYVDGPNGVTLDDCARISRQVSTLLDVHDPISVRYQLEVSSPGLERPLFRLAHYQRVVGKRIKVRLRMADNAQRNLVGVLQAVEEPFVILQVDDEVKKIAFDKIEKAQLIYDPVR